MTAIERFQNSISGNNPSSFFWDCIGYRKETIKQWHKEGLPAKVETGGFLGQYGKLPYDFFGLDWVNFAPTNFYFSPAFEAKVLKDENRTEIVVDESGVILRRSKVSVSMPQYLEYPVKDKESYESLLFRKDAASSERWLPEVWSKWKQDADVFSAPVAVFLIGFFAIIRELMGVEEGMIAFYDKPRLVRRILKDHCDFCIELVRRTEKKTRIDFCYLWEDMSYKNGMLISPALFEEFITSEATRFIEAMKMFGVPNTIIDSDGDIRELIPLYMNCGANGFLPFEVQAGMDILLVRKQYPDLIIIGGIDKLAIARGGEALEKEIDEKVKLMVNHGRYIPSLDHQAHPEMPLANYRQYVARVREVLQDACSSVHVT